MSSGIEIGRYGVGTMMIHNGGSATALDGVIGRESGSTGTVTVTGNGSTWNNTNTLHVGNFGMGRGTLTITDGGSVSNQNGFIVSSLFDRSEVTVSSAGSTWANTEDLSIGGTGFGRLIATNGGLVSVGGILAVKPAVPLLAMAQLLET